MCLLGSNSISLQHRSDRVTRFLLSVHNHAFTKHVRIKAIPKFGNNLLNLTISKLQMISLLTLVNLSIYRVRKCHSIIANRKPMFAEVLSICSAKNQAGCIERAVHHSHEN